MFRLATIYTAVNGDIKRVILRVLEIPVRGMGMGSPEILKLVENCPKGAETLVTRIIHILTEQSKSIIADLFGLIVVLSSTIPRSR